MANPSCCGPLWHACACAKNHHYQFTSVKIAGEKRKSASRSFPIQDISAKSYVAPQGGEMSEEKMTREHLNWRKEKEMAAIEDRRVKSGNKRGAEDEGGRAQSQHRNRVDQTLLPRARGNIRVLRCLGESTKRKRRIQEN